jgi:hypothetical protein
MIRTTTLRDPWEAGTVTSAHWPLTRRIPQKQVHVDGRIVVHSGCAIVTGAPAAGGSTVHGHIPQAAIVEQGGDDRSR